MRLYSDIASDSPVSNNGRGLKLYFEPQKDGAEARFAR